MHYLMNFVDLFLHLDKHLFWLIQAYGLWTYVILFLIIFCETGLVITPILPGDSLIFAAGAFAAAGSLHIAYLFILLCIAAIGGNMVNYRIGKYLGLKLFQGAKPLVKIEYLTRTQKFYEHYGDKTIIITRFFPIVRTFAPFAAGLANMSYWRFSTYNIVGGMLWISIFLWGGYFFGNLPTVKKHFTLVIFAIILISLLPVFYKIASKYWRSSRKIWQHTFNKRRA